MKQSDGASPKKVKLTFNTTQEHLAQLGMTEEDVKENITFVAQCFGTRYLKLFPLNLHKQDVERVRTLSVLLRRIENSDGFRRFLKQFDKNNIEHHLFTARIAAWLLGLGFSVVLEPELRSPSGGAPDILASLDESQYIVECKDFDTSEFYQLQHKEEIARLVYEQVQTCDQIDLYLNEHLSTSDIETVLSDRQLVTTIYKLGMNQPESRITIDSRLDIGIVQKPTIVGAEEDFPRIALGLILEDNSTHVRLPGYAFMMGGRSVGVYGPPPDYSRRWDDKRSQSKKQAVEGLSMLVIVNGDNELGDPILREEYFNRVWLTGKNAACSAVALIRFATFENQPEFDFHENPHAQHPLMQKVRAVLGCK